MVHCYQKILACFVLSAIITKLNGSRILAVFPTPSISHHVVFRPYTQELVRRGHDVTVITPDPAFLKGEAPANLTEIDVHDISYGAWREYAKTINPGRTYGIKDQRDVIYYLSKIFIEQLQTKQVQDIINNKNLHFDLIITELTVRPTLIFSHIFKAPVIQISSCGPLVDTYRIAGIPNHPLLQPWIVRQRIYNLTFWEKIRETFQQFRFTYLYDKLEKEHDEMLRGVFGPDTPTLSTLYNNVAMMFINLYALWHDNESVPPNVIYLGGMHLKPPAELPEDLKHYLDSSSAGVIYMSFGTNVPPSILPPRMVKMMTKVFGDLPYNVIWKWDKDLPDKPSNIKVVKWLPQLDLLHHKNVKLFITQGGLQSTDEAIDAGVPVIGLPVIADQWLNVEKYVLHGIGKQLDIETFSEEEFKNAIVTVIEDPSYRNNIIRLRTLVRDQPQTSLERAVWWTELVLTRGAEHLRARSRNMSAWEYYEMNLLLLLLASSFTCVTILCITLCYLYRIMTPFIKYKVL